METQCRNRRLLLVSSKSHCLPGYLNRRRMFGFFALVLCTPMLAFPAELVGAGYLEDYSQLKADESRHGTYFWMDPSFHPKNYRAVMVGPIEVWYHPESKYKGIRPEELSLLSQELRETLLKRLAEGFDIVREPGSGTLLINAAIVDLGARRPDKKLRNFLPIGIVTTGIKSGLGKNYVLSGSALEAELVDTQSGKRVGLIVVKNLGTRRQDTTTWEQIQTHFDEYASMLVRRIGN